MPHLNYANVVSTIALLIAIGTGGAYAAGQFGSKDIRNDSIQSKDLKDRRAVGGRDVRPNSLHGREIDEASLIASQFARVSGDEQAYCEPEDETYVDCATASVSLKRPSRLLIVATGSFASVGSDGAMTSCEIRIDGADAAISETPGEVGTPKTSSTATDGFARTHLSPVLPRGHHAAALACNQLTDDEARIWTPTIAVLALTANG